MLKALSDLITANFSSDAEFEREFKLNPKTVYDWKRGKSASYLNVLVELAAYFNVTTDYLLTGKETEKKERIPALNEFEYRVLDYLSLMTDLEQAELIGEMKTITKDRRKEAI